MSPTRPRRVVISATCLAIVASAAALVLSFVPIWPLVLLPHFRVQHAALALVLVAAAGGLRLRGYLDAAAIAALLLLLIVTPDLCAARRPVPDRGTPLRVLLLNVHMSSTAYSDVRALIDDAQPDVVGLVEVDARWVAELAPALARFPARFEAARRDNIGMALYAREPFTASLEEHGGGTPSIVATSARYALVLVHPLPPVTGALLDRMHAQVAATVVRLHELAVPAIVLGDFNATPWSPPFRTLLGDANLCDTRTGFGLQASFPTWLSVARIPIDHVLVDCAIGVADRRVERDVGSDHFPVVVDLVLP